MNAVVKNAVARTLGRLAVGAAVAALVGVGSIGPAAAEQVPPSLEGFHRVCGGLQSSVNSLIAEYKNATPERREDILIQLRSLGTTWIQIGCRNVFGSITKEVVVLLGVPDPFGEVDLGLSASPAPGVDGATTSDASPRVAASNDDQDRDTGKKGKKGKKGKGRKK